MAIDLDTVVADMLAAAKQSFGKDWKHARAFAERELRLLAGALRSIGEQVAEGTIDDAQAKAMLRIHRNATESVFLTARGLGVIAVNNALDAALGVVRKVVNKAAGIDLI